MPTATPKHQQEYERTHKAAFTVAGTTPPNRVQAIRGMIDLQLEKGASWSEAKAALFPAEDCLVRATLEG